MPTWKALTILVASMVACVTLSKPAAAASAVGPREVVESAIVRILGILPDGSVNGAPLPDRAAAIRQIAGELFDFDEISRRALARHWQARTPDERAEFVALFRNLLERSYMAQLGAYGGETITFVGESVNGDSAKVRSKLVTKRGKEIPLDFRMRAHDGRWRVVDVVVAGFSFVSSFRSQFDRVIQAESYSALCERLRKKSFDSAVAERGSQS